MCVCVCEREKSVCERERSVCERKVCVHERKVFVCERERKGRGKVCLCERERERRKCVCVCVRKGKVVCVREKEQVKESETDKRESSTLLYVIECDNMGEEEREYQVEKDSLL